MQESIVTFEILLCFHYCTVLCSVLQHSRNPTCVGFLKPDMALRQSQGSRAVPDHPQYISSLPEPTVKISRDRVDTEEPHSSNTEGQSSTPMPASSCPTDGPGEDFDHGESPIHHDSMEEDSLSEYENVRSEGGEEQDYEEDEELHTDADRMTYYVHCCPEDESYLEGMDCHEGAESINKPSTSREADAGGNPGDAWEYSEGVVKYQRGTEELVHKCPKSITESTFIQAPMAEDEEDDEEVVEEEEDHDYNDDDVEEDETYFAYEQEESKNLHQGPNYSNGMSRGEEDLSKDYGMDKSIPEKCKGDAQTSFIGHREGNEKSNAGVKVDHSGNCEVGRADKNSNQRSVFRKHQICKDRGSRPENTENRDDFQKRHSYRDHGREKREAKCLHVRSDNPENSIGRGQSCPHSYRAKTRRDREQSVDEKMDQILNEVKTKMKAGPQGTGTDRGIAEKSRDERRIPGRSQVSVPRPHGEESRPNAPNTPMQPLDAQLQKDLARPTKEDCLRSNLGQVTVQFS